MSGASTTSCVDGWSLARIFGEAVNAYRRTSATAGSPPRIGRALPRLRRLAPAPGPGSCRGLLARALAGFDEPTPLPYGSGSPG